MKLLGIRVCEHDSNFSYFDGKNLRYFKSERLNGIKHHAYNDLYIWRDVIKDKFGDNPDTIDEIAIVLDPWLYKNKPWDRKNENFFPSIDYPHINANCPVYRVDHHYAHALSVYDDFDIHMVFDGFGDKEISWSIIKNDKIIERGDFSKHGSLGAELGGAARLFDIKAVHTADLAGKLMGLQSYGTFNKEFYKTLSYDIYQVIDLYNIKNWEYFKGDYKVSCLTALDWIKTIHEKSGEILLETFKKYCNKSDKICFTGGVAQNVIWNTKLKDYFNNLHVPPHTPDEGLSLGAIEFLRKKNNLSRFKLDNFPYSQLDESPNENPTKETINKAANLLSQGKIIGWYQGHGEVGPRALGNRSILMDPRIKNGKKLINKIKKRENYRPFGASILHDKAKIIFKNYYDNPYMTYVSDISKEYDSIRHIDGSCRYQSVYNGIFYDLISKFYDLTGCPIVLNTSLNINGEPIAGSIRQAKELFNRSNLDCLIYGNEIMEKQNANKN